MTGIEAVSNGVPAIPAARVAQRGDDHAVDERDSGHVVCWHRPALPRLRTGARSLGNPTLLSQLAEQLAGRSWFYYLVQATTLAVLVLAAKTSYADFPRLASILARDRFVPYVFAFRGDRVGLLHWHLCPLRARRRSW